MEGAEIPNKYRGLLNRPNGGRIKVFLICLLVSAFIWFMRALSDDYSHQEAIPVKVVGLRPDFTVGNDIPTHIELSLNSHGFGMIGEALSKGIDTLRIDLGHISAGGQYTMSPQKIKFAAEQMFGNDMEITQFNPESFQVTVVKKMTKKVRIEPIVNVEVEENFFLRKDAFAIPDSIVIQGSESALQQITSIQTEPLSLTSISRSDTLTAQLTSPPGVKLPYEQVEVVIPVDEYTEKSIILPINLPEVGSEYYLKTFPDSVKVTFLVGLKEYESVQASMFKASVDPGDLSKIESAYKLPIVLTRQPESISQILLSPGRVEFVLLAK
ncbi:MAG: hypothetical protein ACI84C_000815 [Flavobacteriales bacterium]|jgi:hypothetical protein